MFADAGRDRDLSKPGHGFFGRLLKHDRSRQASGLKRRQPETSLLYRPGAPPQ